MSKDVLDIMLDLEFFGTETDMVKDFPGQDAFPIVSSIGMVIQLNGEIVSSDNFAVSFQEQLNSGAKFGRDCMLEFWTKQPLFGAEMARTVEQTNSIDSVLVSIVDAIYNARQLAEQPFLEVNVLGNNLIADNSKVIRLFAKYSSQPLPWTYFENTDYREILKIATYLGFDRRAAGSNFTAKVLRGEYSHLGHTCEALHNAEYDCLKQLSMLNDARAYLKEVKEKVNA